MEKSIIEEVKVINSENDMYGTYSKAKSICSFLQLEDNRELLANNNLITIYGPWGSGKSCLMKTIEKEIDKGKFVTKWFNTWKYEKDDNLPYSLFKYIIQDNHKEEFKENARFAWRTVKTMFKSIAKSTEYNIGIMTIKPEEIIKAAEEQVRKEEKYECLWEQMKSFEDDFEKIDFDGKRMIVFLDDLDRCDSENIITLISSIKILLSGNKNIIFIVGIDKQAVTLALKNKYHNDYNKADEYLEKIFPINFSVANNVQVNNFADYISSITELSSEDSKTVLQFFDKLRFNNIRHIKKVLRKYYTIKDFLKSQEIDIGNKYMVVLVMYIIILSFFYSDEYEYLLHNEKEKNVLCSIQLNAILSGSGRVIQKWYNELEEICCWEELENIGNTNIFDFIIRFSSYKIDKHDLKMMGYNGESCMISYNDFKGLFKDNICNTFLDFVLENSEMLKLFYDKKKYRKEEIEKIIEVINSIL